MNFFADNYIWFIVAFIVILMTIIGYIAEKTGFVRRELSKKEISPKQKKKDEVVEELESMTLEATEEMSEPVEDVLVEQSDDVHFDEPFVSDMEVNTDVQNYEDANVSEDLTESATEEVDFSVNDDLNTPFGDNVTSQESEVSVEDLNVPFGDSAFESTEISNIDEDLNEPFGNVVATEEENTFKQNLSNEIEFDEISNEDLNVPFGDNVKEEKNNDLGLELPDIDSVSSNITNTDESDSEEDIWKF